MNAPAAVHPVQPRIQPRRFQPDHTAIMGVCDDGLPILVDWTNPRPGSFLIGGSNQDGVTQLLQLAAISTLAHTPHRQLEILVLSGQPEKWTHFERFPGEPNLVGATVTIVPVSTGVPITVTTDANGNYTIPNVPAGNGTVTVTPPTGTTVTTNNNPQNITVTPGQSSTTTPIGFQGQGTVTGHVFTDTNGNGVQDSGEPNLSGIQVTLTPEGGGTPIVVTTDGNGNYTANSVPSGNVTVDVADPAGNFETTNTDPQTINLTAGGSATANPVGYQPLGGVTGHVFSDVNGNGVQDSGEPNLVGVTVTITTA